MSEIVDLLMTKAASYRELAGQAPEVETPENSWGQIKKAAVAKLVSESDLTKEAAEALVDKLGEHYGQQ